MKKKISLVVVIIIAVMLYINQDTGPSKAPRTKDISAKNKAINKTTTASSKLQRKSAKPNQVKPAIIPVIKSADRYTIPKTPKESLTLLSKTLLHFASSSAQKSELLDQLKTLKLKPIEAINSNAETGSMSIIRTKKTLLGTRYIHAQYFGKRLQHMSFEFQKGPKAFDNAIKSIMSVFNVDCEMKRKSSGFISCSTKNGYVVWVKRMEKEDLKDDPFNAYSDDDIGTIRVAVEQEIHGDDHDDHL
jgi:hypothetical protein